MAYKTNNPVPSNSMRDFSDNAENLDRAINGAAPTWTDRKGNIRQSLAGMQQTFNDLINDLVLVNKGNYAAGILIQSYNTIFTKDGLQYRPLPTTTLPYTTTGNWNKESSKFTVAADNTLRQELASDTGAALVGFSYSGNSGNSLNLLESLQVQGAVNVMNFGAAGDGVTNDYPAFLAAEAYAFATGQSLLLPSGRAFKLNSSLVTRVTILGAGATVIRGAGTSGNLLTSAVIRVVGATVAIIGLTIVGNNGGGGISATGGNLIVRDCNIYYSRNNGIFAEDCQALQVSNTIIHSVIQHEASGTSAFGAGVTSRRVQLVKVDGVTTSGFQSHGFLFIGDGVPSTVSLVSCSASDWNKGVREASDRVAGALFKNIASFQLEGLITHSFANDETHAGVRVFNNEVGLKSVGLISGVQYNNLGGHSDGCAVSLEALKAAETVVDIENIDVSYAYYGVKIRGVEYVSLRNIYGRVMRQQNPSNALILAEPTGGLTIGKVSMEAVKVLAYASTFPNASDIRTYNLESFSAKDLGYGLTLTVVADSVTISDCQLIKTNSAFSVTGAYAGIQGQNLSFTSSKFEPKQPESPGGNYFFGSGSYRIYNCDLLNFNEVQTIEAEISIQGSKLENTRVPMSSYLSLSHSYLTMEGRPCIKQVSPNILTFIQGNTLLPGMGYLAIEQTIGAQGVLTGNIILNGIPSFHNLDPNVVSETGNLHL